MKWTRLITLICILAVGTAFSGFAGEVTTQSKDGVFIHLSQGQSDPHRVLMALNMADMMSEDHPVLVYFDIKAIEVVVKDAKDITYSHFPSSKTQLAKLREKGVVMMICPGCLKAAEKSAEDLAPGMQIADKAKFFSFTDGRILSLDY